MTERDPLLESVISKMVAALNPEDIDDLALLFDVRADEVVEALMEAVAERSTMFERVGEILSRYQGDYRR